MKKKTKQSRLSVTVPQELRRGARAKAIREGTSVSALIRQWLARYIAQTETEQEVDANQELPISGLYRTFGNQTETEQEVDANQD